MTFIRATYTDGETFFLGKDGGPTKLVPHFFTDFVEDWKPTALALKRELKGTGTKIQAVQMLSGGEEEVVWRATA